jgi:hypothetical protein
VGTSIIGDAIFAYKKENGLLRAQLIDHGPEAADEVGGLGRSSSYTTPDGFQTPPFPSTLPPRLLTAAA